MACLLHHKTMYHAKHSTWHCGERLKTVIKGTDFKGAIDKTFTLLAPKEKIADERRNGVIEVLP